MKKFVNNTDVIPAYVRGSGCPHKAGMTVMLFLISFLLFGRKNELVLIDKQNKFTSEWEKIGNFYNLADNYNTCLEVIEFMRNEYTSESFRCRVK